MKDFLETMNPYNGEILNRYALWSKEELKTALQISESAYVSWKETELWQRVDLVRKLGKLLIEKSDKIAPLISLEMGKPIEEARAELYKCAASCAYLADNAEAWLRPVELETETHRTLVYFRPMGAVLAVMPWNFPFWQVIRQALPALLGANVFLLKHASRVWGCALELEKLFEEAGFPKGVFITLQIRNEALDFVMSSRHICGVAFTGSENAGSKVAALAGKYLKKSVLELGGSDPFIVFEDADLKWAAEEALKSRFQNAGQSCIAAKRFIVHHKVFGDFVAEMKKGLKTLKPGNSLDKACKMGPMVSAEAAEELEKQMLESMDEKTQLLGGWNRNQALVDPLIMLHVNRNARVWKEETFGPIAVIMPFDSDEEAVELANDTRYGLGAAVFSKDVFKAEKIGLQLECGQVFINEMVKSNTAFPFGGVKDSGYGRELSEWGMKEFLNIKPVVQRAD